MFVAMAHFTKESLEKFQEMCAEGVDFSEGEVYNYAMCLDAKGEVYGVGRGDQCKKGRPISDQEGSKYLKDDSNTKSRISKLKAEFLKKTGREMTGEELKKAARMLKKK